MQSLADDCPVTRPTSGGIRPLLLLTLINYLNYLDRQVVYGMSPLIGDAFGLSKFQPAFFLSGVLFLLVARRRRRALGEPHALTA